MRMAIVVAAAALAATAAPAAVAAKSPCTLVTRADASQVLGAAAGKPKAQLLGLYRSCTYTAGAKTVTVQTRPLSRSDFVKSAKANPGPVKALSGVGAAAYSVAGGYMLLVWKNGTEVTFLVVGTANSLASEKALAKKALARL